MLGYLGLGDDDDDGFRRSKDFSPGGRGVWVGGVG